MLFSDIINFQTMEASGLSQVVTTVNARHSSIDSHSRAVDRISANVRDFYERKKKFRTFHDSTNSTRHASKESKLVNHQQPLTHPRGRFQK